MSVLPAVEIPLDGDGLVAAAVVIAAQTGTFSMDK